MTAVASHLLLPLALGAFCGIAGGLFGIGGGVIAIPILGILYALDQQAAQGTVLLMVLPNVGLAFWRYQRRVGLDLRIAGLLGVTALVASYPAARIAIGLDPRDLRLAFAGFLAILAAIIAYRTRRGLVAAQNRRPLAWGWTAAVGALGGSISGLFGVGGAFIAPPLLTTFFGLRQVEAQGLALALVGPGTVVALIAYAGAGEVEWRLGLTMAVGGVAAIPAGVAFAHRLPERSLRLAFCGFLAAAAGLLALHG